MKDTVALLDPYIAPAPVQFVPEAPGWYAMGILLLLLVLFAVSIAYRKYRKNRYRRTALEWFARQEKKFLENKDYIRWVYTANMLAKRISVRVYGKADAASLRQDEWIAYLNQKCPSVSFTAADKETIQAVYNPQSVIREQQAADFSIKIKQWIKKHRSK